MGKMRLANELSFTELGLEQYLDRHKQFNAESKTTESDSESRAVPSSEQVLDASSYKDVSESFFRKPTNAAGEEITNLCNVRKADPAKYEALVGKHNAEMIQWESLVTKFFDDNGVDFLVTPCTVGPPPACLGSSADYKRAEKDGSIWKHHWGLTLGSPLIIADCLNALPIPSLALPTPAQHVNLSSGSPFNPLPAGVLIWGRPHQDKDLINLGLSLEQVLKRLG